MRLFKHSTGMLEKLDIWDKQHDFYTLLGIHNQQYRLVITVSMEEIETERPNMIFTKRPLKKKP